MAILASAILASATTASTSNISSVSITAMGAHSTAFLAGDVEVWSSSAASASATFAASVGFASSTPTPWYPPSAFAFALTCTSGEHSANFSRPPIARPMVDTSATPRLSS